MNPDSKHESRVQPLRARLRAETTRAITSAAEEVFAARGVAEARMEEIASRAGVSVGTLYNHFEDRAALLHALVDLRRQELAGKLDACLQRTRGEPFAAQLLHFAFTVLEHFEAQREFCAISLQRDAAHVEQPSEAMIEMRARVEALIRRGVEQKALRPVSASLAATMLMGLVRAALVHELRNPNQLPATERASAVAEFFLRGAGC